LDLTGAFHIVRWLYELFIAMDGNFRLRLKRFKTKRSTNDPELGSGWSYYVNEEKYQSLIREILSNNPRYQVKIFAHLLGLVSHLTEQENVPSCGTEFHAVNQANIRGMEDGLSVTGVVECSCARHSMTIKRGDTQRGERFVILKVHVRI
jgi:hypothetical protein